MYLSSGYFTIGRLFGMPVRIHWTTPIGAAALSGFAFVPGAWIGFLLLVLAHEMGHALLIRAFGGHVLALQLHGIGGECVWDGYSTSRQRSIIAWGGVLGQLAVLLTTPLWASLLAPGQHPFLAQLVSMFTGTNVAMMVLNLLPIPPLDGAEAWRLFRRR